MLPYWLLYLLTAIPALKTGGPNPIHRPSWGAYFLALVIILLIGLRYEVGADWGAYQLIYDDIAYLSLPDALERTDPAYGLINWLGALFEADIWFVNVICGVIFAWGLFAFAFNLPNPWLAIAVATPYLIIVVAMGYSRQGVAIGCLMLSLVAIHKQSFAKFLFWLLVASAFHRSALVILPIVGFAYTRNRVLVILFGAIAAVIGYYLLVASQLSSIIANYADNERESQGATIRALMNVVPAIIYLANMRKFPIGISERKMWRNFALGALVSVPLLALVESDTVLDRFSLYIVPIQLFVFAWLPSLGTGQERQSRVITILILIYSATILFVWSNFAVHADSWLPYRIFPQFMPE